MDKVTTLNTAELLAKEHGVSEKTIRCDGKRAEELDRLAETKPEEAQAVRDGIKRPNEVRVELVLKLEPLLRAKARERQQEHGGTAPGRAKTLPQNSAEVKPIETRKELARAAHVSHDTIAPLACPRCFAQFGAPESYPAPVCPSCKRETLKPKS